MGPSDGIRGYWVDWLGDIDDIGRLGDRLSAKVRNCKSKKKKEWVVSGGKKVLWDWVNLQGKIFS